MFTEESKGGLIIQAAKFFHLEGVKYLLELYENLKADLETLYTEGPVNQCPVTHLPFRMDNRSNENLLHHLRGENGLIMMDYLSKCSEIVELINQPYKPEVNMTPLAMAIISDEIPIALKMVELGGYIDNVNKTGGSPIYEAVMYGNMVLIKAMLENGKYTFIFIFTLQMKRNQLTHKKLYLSNDRY